MSTAWNIHLMNFSINEMEFIKEQIAEEEREKYPPVPLDPSNVEVYWAIYRKAKRPTKKNGGWILATYLHASCKKMEMLMEKKGWYLPEFLLKPSSILFAVPEERKLVEDLARSICSPEYSEIMTSKEIIK